MYPKTVYVGLSELMALFSPLTLEPYCSIVSGKNFFKNAFNWVGRKQQGNNLFVENNRVVYTTGWEK